MLSSHIGSNEYHKLELPRAWDPGVVQALKKAIRKEDPSLVFLMETQLIGSEMKKLQQEVGLLQGLFVNSVGRKGGLALLWKFDIQVELRGLNQWFIDVFVNSGGELVREINTLGSFLK